jgi:hypothetical protein
VHLSLFIHNYLPKIYFIMKLKFGSFIVGGSGKIGGHVVSHNKGGQYLRTKVKPTNPQSTYQLGVRSRFSTNSKNWISLTDVQRAAWNTAVGIQKKVNAMGDIMILSGKALYSKINQNLGLIGSAAINLPVNAGAGFSLTTFSATVVHATGVTTLTYTAAIPATHKLVVLATPPMSPGISFVKNKLRFMASYATADASPITATAAYTARFGTPAVAGQKVHFRAFAIEIASGIASQGVECVAVVS